MMNKLLFFCIIALFTATIGCNNTNNDTINKEVKECNKDSTNNAKGFFPVTSFLKGQLIILDSLPITLMYTVTSNKKTDTNWLKKEQVRPLLEPFIADEITATNLITFFKETKFKDETINAITYTYSPLKPLPDSLAIQHWDMYINPETGSVQKIYLVKEKAIEDEVIITQLIWQTNKWAKITTLKKKANGETSIVKEEKIIWSFNEL
jgi:hypothetical protein